MAARMRAGPAALPAWTPSQKTVFHVTYATHVLACPGALSAWLLIIGIPHAGLRGAFSILCLLNKIRSQYLVRKGC